MCTSTHPTRSCPTMSTTIFRASRIAVLAVLAAALAALCAPSALAHDGTHPAWLSPALAHKGDENTAAGPCAGLRRISLHALLHARPGSGAQELRAPQAARDGVLRWPDPGRLGTQGSVRRERYVGQARAGDLRAGLQRSRRLRRAARRRSAPGRSTPTASSARARQRPTARAASASSTTHSATSRSSTSCSTSPPSRPVTWASA